MAWQLSYESPRAAFVLSASGALSAADVAAATARMAGDPNFQPGARVLYDYLKLDATADPATVMFAGPFEAVFAPTARRAFVVNPSALRKFAAAIGTAPASGEIKVFADHAGALDWLHLGAPPGKHLI